MREEKVREDYRYYRKKEGAVFTLVRGLKCFNFEL